MRSLSPLNCARNSAEAIGELVCGKVGSKGIGDECWLLSDTGAETGNWSSFLASGAGLHQIGRFLGKIEVFALTSGDFALTNDKFALTYDVC